LTPLAFLLVALSRFALAVLAIPPPFISLFPLAALCGPVFVLRALLSLALFLTLLSALRTLALFLIWCGPVLAFGPLCLPLFLALLSPALFFPLLSATVLHLTAFLSARPATG
jgi:hypothetical protein